MEEGVDEGRGGRVGGREVGFERLGRGDLGQLGYQAIAIVGSFDKFVEAKKTKDKDKQTNKQGMTNRSVRPRMDYVMRD